MKVTLLEKEIKSYSLTVEVELEGEKYIADLSYDTHDGFEVRFFDTSGKSVSTPDWAIQMEEKDEEGNSLGYILESKIGGWFRWEDKNV